MQRVVDAYRSRTKGRVVILDEAGILRADSDSRGAPVPARDFSTRPEVRRALGGDQAHGFRHSTLLGQDLLYVAVPAQLGQPIFIVPTLSLISNSLLFLALFQQLSPLAALGRMYVHH